MSMHVGRRWVPLFAILVVLAGMSVIPGDALAQDPAARTVVMTFELAADPAGQHTTTVGAGGSTLYGMVRLTGTADLDGRPVDVDLLFSPLYRDGTGPFTGWITLTGTGDDVLGLGFSGYSVKRGALTDIEGAVGTVGGAGSYEGVTGNGQMRAVRGGEVGSNVRYELVLDLAGLPPSAIDSPFADPAAGGAALFSAYSDLLVAGEAAALGDVLDAAFIVARTDGTFATRDQYLADLPELRSYSVADVHEVRTDGAVSVHMVVASDLTVDGKPFRTDPAPMLASFRWTDGRWGLVAQANFNLPK